ncbi:MAG: alanyl-tRNA editing protein [Candidatus Norongarragalinales archaeon]
MTELLCLKDAYLKESSASVAEANEKEIVFDKTVFYPQGGGLASDKGAIECKGKTYEVLEVKKKDGKAIHYVDSEGLNAGDVCTLKIDWERRYALMRMHTAAHVLGSAAYENGALITGNAIAPGESRFDFSFENFDRQKLDETVAKANEKLASAAEVKVYELPREEAFKTPGIVKLAGALPPSIPVLRVVEIVGLDTQADGGVHVANTRECGKIEITRLENKGAKNKRIYFKLLLP